MKYITDDSSFSGYPIASLKSSRIENINNRAIENCGDKDVNHYSYIAHRDALQRGAAKLKL
jgi:hypothetical protein